MGLVKETGKIVYCAPLAGATEYNMDISLESGFYIISVRGGGINFTHKNC